MIEVLFELDNGRWIRSVPMTMAQAQVYFAHVRDPDKWISVRSHGPTMETWFRATSVETVSIVAIEQEGK